MINDDMPFIIDSSTAYLTGQHLAVHRLIHPVLRVARDESGRLAGVESAAGDSGWPLESCVFIEVDRCRSESLVTGLQQGLAAVLGEVQTVTADWKSMMIRLAETVALFESKPPRSCETDRARSIFPVPSTFLAVRSKNWRQRSNRCCHQPGSPISARGRNASASKGCPRISPGSSLRSMP